VARFRISVFPFFGFPFLFFHCRVHRTCHASTHDTHIYTHSHARTRHTHHAQIHIHTSTHHTRHRFYTVRSNSSTEKRTGMQCCPPHSFATPHEPATPGCVPSPGDGFCPGLSAEDWDSLYRQTDPPAGDGDDGGAIASAKPTTEPQADRLGEIRSVQDLERSKGVATLPVWKAVHHGPLHLRKLASVDIVYHRLKAEEAGEIAMAVAVVEDMCYTFAMRVETCRRGETILLWCRLLQRSDTSEKGRSDNLRLLIPIPSLPDEGDGKEKEQDEADEEGGRIDPGEVVARLVAMGFSVRELPRVHVLRTPLNGGTTRNLLRKWLGVH